MDIASRSAALPFSAGYLAQTKLYTTIIDRQVRTERDSPTIGLLICREKNETVARYTMEGMVGENPLSVSTYESARKELPSPAEIEAALDDTDTVGPSPHLAPES